MSVEQLSAKLCVFGFGRAAVVQLGHGNAELLGDEADSFGKSDVLDFLNEAENVAFRAASEAIVELARGVDGKRRRLFAVKGTQPGVVLRSRLAQLYVVPDDADDVGLLADEFFEVGSFSHEYVYCRTDWSNKEYRRLWTSCGRACIK